MLLLPLSVAEAVFSLKEEVKEASRLELCEAVGDKGIIGSRVGNTTGEHLHNNTLDTQRPSHWSFGLYQKYCY